MLLYWSRGCGGQRLLSKLKQVAILKHSLELQLVKKLAGQIGRKSQGLVDLTFGQVKAGFIGVRVVRLFDNHQIVAGTRTASRSTHRGLTQWCST